MGRFMYGALVGGAAMYLLDPESGPERRRKLASWWRENQGSMRQAGQVTARKIEDFRPAAQKATQTAAESAQAVGAKIRGGRGQGAESMPHVAPEPPTAT